MINFLQSTTLTRLCKVTFKLFFPLTGESGILTLLSERGAQDIVLMGFQLAPWPPCAACSALATVTASVLRLGLWVLVCVLRLCLHCVLRALQLVQWLLGISYRALGWVTGALLEYLLPVAQSSLMFICCAPYSAFYHLLCWINPGRGLRNYGRVVQETVERRRAGKDLP